MPASPTIDTIRAAIVSAIKSALNVGSPASVVTVHDYRRYWRDYDKFKALFQRTDAGGDVPSGRLNGWMVTRLRTREVEALEWSRFYQVHAFELEGFLGVQDAAALSATEKVFQDQIEKIRDNLRLNLTVYQTTEQTNPVCQVESIEPFDFGERTVWKANLLLEAESIEVKFS